MTVRCARVCIVEIWSGDWPKAAWCECGRELCSWTLFREQIRVCLFCRLRISILTMCLKLRICAGKPTRSYSRMFSFRNSKTVALRFVRNHMEILTFVLGFILEVFGLDKLEEIERFNIMHACRLQTAVCTHPRGLECQNVTM